MSATFVLSPGRCGTQWLSQHLQSGGNGAAVICHEPLHFAYDPLHNSPSSPLTKNAERLVTHLQGVRDHLSAGKQYIECGFPCWRHIEWYRRELQDEVKVVYIHREPVANAASLLKLNAFVPPMLPHLAEKQLFHPLAPDSLLPEYGTRWSQMSPFEKCLYYWAEVNLQAAQYQTSFPASQWLTIPYHKLFTEVSLQRIAEFANVAFIFHQSMLDRVDQYHGLPQSHIHSADIYKHPQILAMAARLGYEYSAN